MNNVVYIVGLCLQNIPEGSVILLHACAHNPTGVDPKVRWNVQAWVVTSAFMLGKNNVGFNQLLALLFTHVRCICTNPYGKNRYLDK